MTLQEKYEKQKEINKELVDYNDRLLTQAAAATKRVVALEKEVEKHKWNDIFLEDCAGYDKKIAEEYSTLQERIEKLEKENAELKEKINILENCDRLGDMITEAYKEQLAQAKEIIKGLLDLPDLISDRTSEHTELIGRAEQFLEEEI